MIESDSAPDPESFLGKPNTMQLAWVDATWFNEIYLDVLALTGWLYVGFACLVVIVYLIFIWREGKQPVSSLDMRLPYLFLGSTRVLVPMLRFFSPSKSRRRGNYSP